MHEDQQRGLLDLLLAEFPGVLTYREALVARVGQPEHPIEAEDFDQTARALAESGLVVREGQLLMPSRRPERWWDSAMRLAE